MIGEVECVAPLDAKEIVINTALVAVVAAHNLHAPVRTPDPERRLAAVAAMRAHGADMLHLPGTSLVAIRPRGERTHRADIDTHAALFALQMIFFDGCDDGRDTAILGAQR